MYLTWWKKEKKETDEQTSKWKLLEELDGEIVELEFYKRYFDKAIFEEGFDFQQRTYLVTLRSNTITVKNEIKEDL